MLYGIHYRLLTSNGTTIRDHVVSYPAHHSTTWVYLKFLFTMDMCAMNEAYGFI